MGTLSGRCFCGACTWTARDEILWAALCHCKDCRRAASSDYVSWFGVPRDSVTWTGPRKTYHSSENVTRSFCSKCGSPLSFQTDILPDEIHLYAPSLDDPSVYKPTAHIFWSEHLPWVQDADDLPKHEKGLQDATEKGVDLLGDAQNNAT